MTGSGTVSGVLYGFKAGPSSGGATPGTPCPGTVGTPCVVDGVTASGSPPSTPPVLVAGQDGTNVETIKTDTAGDVLVAGPAAVGAAAKSPITTGVQDDSGNVLALYAFPDQASFSVSAGADVVAITGTAAKNTFVGHIAMSWDSAQTVTIRQGTGSTCGSNTATLYGPFANLLAFTLDFDSASALHTTVAARDICVHFGGAVTGGGGAVYGTH